MNELIKLNAARKALSEAKTLQEIKEIKNIAIAVKAYAKAKGMGVEMKNEASEIEIRAIREMGKLIKEKQDAGEMAKKGENQSNLVLEGNKVKSTLPEIGITRKESSTSKNLSAMSDENFEDIMDEIIENKKPLTKTAMLREAAKKNTTKKFLIPKDTYRIILADPPWRYSDKKEYSPQGAAENHYPTMSIQELCNMEFPKTEKDAVLFLWTTSPLLEESFKVIGAWGFHYKTSFIWDKIKHNMGHYNSVRHEFLLLATKGSCLPDVKKLFDSVQSIERTNKHSEKPEEFRKIIDTLYLKGKRIELFARKNNIKNWDSYGNEKND